MLLEPNICSKKIWTNYSTVSLLWFVQVFLKQTLFVEPVNRSNLEMPKKSESFHFFNPRIVSALIFGNLKIHFYFLSSSYLYLQPTKFDIIHVRSQVKNQPDLHKRKYFNLLSLSPSVKVKFSKNFTFVLLLYCAMLRLVVKSLHGLKLESHACLLLHNYAFL